VRREAVRLFELRDSVRFFALGSVVSVDPRLPTLSACAGAKHQGNDTKKDEQLTAR
jgi:hypothetical protein